MTAQNMMEESELFYVAGGTNSDTTAPRFKVNDKVTLIVYPQFGIGIVKNVYQKTDGWYCTVAFDTGVVDASDIEFYPA